MKYVVMRTLFLVLALSNALFFNAANAANWLMLQGVTESPYPLLWGFLQPAYMRTSGSTLPTSTPPKNPWQGQQSLVNSIQPDLSSSQVFQIQRARLGVRGAIPDSEKISYFVLAEFGNNGITQPGGGAGKVTLTDATITFSQIEGARFRIGQMKVPMSEEVYQGIVTFNYVNLTSLANQQMVERPFWTDGNSPCAIEPGNGPNAPAVSSSSYQRFCNGDSQTQFRSTVVAVRDIGIQVFDSKKIDGWEHSYSLLLGQGGANKDDWNDSLDTSIYWSSERIFGGHKAFRKGYKIYAWQTKGKRTIYDSAALSTGGASLESAEREYNRELLGTGLTYFDGKFRFWAEYIKVDGMIFNGSSGGAVPGALSNNGSMVAQFRTEPEGKGVGGYVDFGYRVTPKVELDIRYDVYNRITNLDSSAEIQFATWTIGAQYFFTQTTKAIINYEFRDAEAPGQSASSTTNLVLGETDDRLSAQLFLFF
ncbi:MAG: porin [Thiohalomonadales bacterium]